MSKSNNSKFIVPCICYKHAKGGCSLYIPDLNMELYGTTFVQVIAQAIVTVTALYTYNADRNIQMPIQHTYEDLLRETESSKTPCFVHMLTLNKEG